MKPTALLKAISIREKFFKLENQKRVNKFLMINLLNRTLKPKKKYRQNVILFFQKRNKTISKTQLYNKCVLTGRNRSVDKQYSISRIKFRNLLQFGIIPGYKKAVW
jgi:small subunit ribosomal protein S14